MGRHHHNLKADQSQMKKKLQTQHDPTKGPTKGAVQKAAKKGAGKTSISKVVTPNDRRVARGLVSNTGLSTAALNMLLESTTQELQEQHVQVKPAAKVHKLSGSHNTCGPDDMACDRAQPATHTTGIPAPAQTAAAAAALPRAGPSAMQDALNMLGSMVVTAPAATATQQLQPHMSSSAEGSHVPV